MTQPERLTPEAGSCELRKNLPPDRHCEVWYEGELLMSTQDYQYALGYEDGFDRALDALTQRITALEAAIAAMPEGVRERIEQVLRIQAARAETEGANDE